MAIDVNNYRLLLALKRSGLSFERVLTIGRQGRFLPDRILARLFRDFRMHPESGLGAGSDGAEFCDALFFALGARTVESVDVSNYEGAVHVHDMNEPIPEEWCCRFPLVIDSGSVEHMFNFPQAIENYMKMLSVGGHLVLLNMPANNHMGHGFYQFSPELFESLFSEVNGFRLCKILLCEDLPYEPFYEVPNVEQSGERLLLINNQPTLLFAIAEKTGHRKELTYPVQYDYARSWSRNRAIARHCSWVGKMKQAVLGALLPVTYFRFSAKRDWKQRVSKFRLGAQNAYRIAKIEELDIPLSH